MRRLIKWTGAAALAGTVACGGVGCWAYQEEVVEAPGPEFTREAILAIIAQESPVYYRDGKTRLGVFFDQEHRIYVPFAELPKDYVNAIVAAEDGNFWTHKGVDPKHVLRAMRDNVMAGHVVAGGSTLTQQTAKNLFYRPDRSARAKYDELVNALKLEEHFSKQDILEFYANQFHVSGNGRGLGIAARYFFDKQPSELTLKECAFLAGLVKAPATYNPFLGATPERREAARRAAEERTSYVLGRMVTEEYITEAQRKEAQAIPLVFRRGSFQYDRSVAMDTVEGRLEDADFVELFARAEIDNPSTAGISIITSLDPDVQREATYALVHHLAELGPQIEGPIPFALPERTQIQMDAGTPLVVHQLYNAKVGDAWSLDVGGRPCVVDATGQARATKMGTPPTAGTLVRVSVREIGKGGAICDLEPKPELQGAVVVLENGLVRAMVGGGDNRNFDRTRAPRQFGSTWKPIVYAAALQLGWLPTDILDNRPNVFPFRDVWYYPSADHQSEPWVSMSLAGARSENLASVWLLAHLADRLNQEQFRRVATLVGVWPQAGESNEAWRKRLGAESISSSPDRFEEYAFTLAREDVMTGMAFSAHPEDALSVRSLGFGRGLSAERARIARGKASKGDALDGTFLALDEAGKACELVSWATPECGSVVPSEDPTVVPDPPIGRIHKSTLESLRTALAARTAELSGKDPWDPEVLALNPDARTLVGIRYLQALAKAMGVQEELPTNLTLPLGGADVSLMEMTAVYQGFLKGERYTFPATGFVDTETKGLRETFALPELPAPSALIAEIRGADGEPLYRLDTKGDRVADALSGEMVGGILRNVVRVGTGRRALDAVEVGGVHIPLAGKTGTTNDYRNAAFLGFAPRVQQGMLHWQDGYTVGVYVGYDDNRSMKKGSLRVQGANGALPVWLGTIKGMAKAGLLGEKGVAEYTPSAGLVVVDGTPPVLAPDGKVRRFAPLTEAVSTQPAGDEPAPTGPPVATDTPADEGEMQDEGAPVRIPVGEPL